MKVYTKIFCIIAIIEIFTLPISAVEAYAYRFEEGSEIIMPIPLTTPFYLTGTPKTHSQDGSRAAIDFQIPDELGLIAKGYPLYTPFDGYATYSESENASGIIEITSTDEKWKVVIAHVLNNTKTAKELVASYPKYVMRGEKIAFQGDSGYTISSEHFPVHVHYEVYKKQGKGYVNDNGIIDICKLLGIAHYCDQVDETGNVLFINDW